MTNKPFTSQCTNVYNEKIYKTIPHAFGLHNVTAMEAHDRTVYDIVKTSIVSNTQPQRQMPMSFNNCNCNFNKSQFVYAHPQLTPHGGVTFTFNPTPIPQHCNVQTFGRGGLPSSPFPSHPETNQQSLTLQQQIALKQLEQQGLELMLIQEQLKKNPYKLHFHHNGQTSTTDLCCGQSQARTSVGMPELTKALATLTSLKQDIAKLGVDKLSPNCPPNTLYSEVYKAKRLLLTKSPDLINKDKPKISCLTEENGLEKNECAGKEVASTSKRNSCKNKKSRKQCKKSKKREKRRSKSKQQRRHSNRESSNSLIDLYECESDEYYSGPDDRDDSSEESDS